MRSKTPVTAQEHSQKKRLGSVDMRIANQTDQLKNIKLNRSKNLNEKSTLNAQTTNDLCQTAPNENMQKQPIYNSVSSLAH